MNKQQLELELKDIERQVLLLQGAAAYIRAKIKQIEQQEVQKQPEVSKEPETDKTVSA